MLSVENIVLDCNNLEVNQSAKAEALQLKSEILWSGCKPYNIQTPTIHLLPEGRSLPVDENKFIF